MSSMTKNPESHDPSDSTAAKVQWKPLEIATVFLLLQPVESSWKELARYLLKEELQYKVNIIETDCFHNAASKEALVEVFSIWLYRTVRAQRTWQTLCNTSKKYGDESLEQYIQQNDLKSGGEPTMKHITRWSKHSPLRTCWYNFAVELVGKSNADIINATHYGGGSHSCLQRVLVTWYESTANHSWQIIVDALRQMDKTRVIESIEIECLISKNFPHEDCEQKHSALEQETMIAKMLHYLFEARKNGRSVKIRYGKVLICGANAAGKTNFLNLLMEKDFQKKHKSTGVTDSRQVKIAFKAMATSEDGEISFKEMSIEDERTELVMHLPSVTDSINNDNASIVISNKMEKGCTETETIMAAKDINASDKKFDSRLHNKQAEVEKVWNILTFVDTGGQPHLISMLPAVNSFAMITFIVYNMRESLDADVKIIQDDKVIPQPYGCKHCQLIKTLASYASSIVLPDLQFLSAFKVLNASNQEKKSTLLSIVGTHSYTMSEKDIQNIDGEFIKMFKNSQGLEEILKPELNKNYKYIIPVDNDKQGIKSSNENASQQISHYTDSKKYTLPSIIRNYLYTQLKKQDEYEVPLNWLILELEIRRKCKENNSILITLSDVLELGKEKELGNEDDIVSGLKFNHLFGVLLYFEKVKGMQELVITNHQWLFEKLTNFVDCMKEIEFNTQIEKKKFELKGIFNESMINFDKLKIREDFIKSGVNTEPKRSFLQLLEYLRFIAPHDAEYFMPTLLTSFELASLHGKSYKTNNTIYTEPMLIQYRTDDKSGSFPRGFFCFLTVQLTIDMKSHWKVPPDKQEYNNLLTFRNEDSGHHITLIDRIFCLEIQVAHDTEDVSPIHNEVYHHICYALKEIGHKFNVKNELNYGFLCNACPKPSEIHMTYLSNNENCKYSYCTSDCRTDLTDAHKVWIKKSSTKEKEKCAKIKGSDRPTLKAINNYVRDQVAVAWHDLGVELLPDKDVQHQLETIRKNHSTDVNECCGRMFQLWLQVDVAASWNKLIEGLRMIKKCHLADNIVIKVLEGLPAPSNVRAKVLSHSSVKVTWEHLPDATEYIISYTTTASHISNRNVTVKDGSTTSHTLTNLEENTSYDITVQATTSDGRKSALGREESVITPAAANTHMSSWKTCTILSAVVVAVIAICIAILLMDIY